MAAVLLAVLARSHRIAQPMAMAELLDGHQIQIEDETAQFVVRAHCSNAGPASFAAFQTALALLMGHCCCLLQVHVVVAAVVAVSVGFAA